MTTIRYQCRSNETVENVGIALDHVRTAMIQECRSAHAADDMVHIATDDGVYCYVTQEDADRDDTGARAFAVIEGGK